MVTIKTRLTFIMCTFKCLLQITSPLLPASRVDCSYSPSLLHHWLSKLRETWYGMGGVVLVGEKMCYDYKVVQ